MCVTKLSCMSSVPRSIAQAPSLAPSTFRSQSQSPFVRQQVITPFTAEEPPRNSRSASLPGGGFSNAGSLGSSKGGDVSAANTSTDTDTNPGQASSVSGSKPFSYVFSSLPKFFGGTRRWEANNSEEILDSKQKHRFCQYSVLLLRGKEDSWRNPHLHMYCCDWRPGKIG